MSTILVIDDDEDVRESLRDALTVIGREVVTATDGLDALGILKRILRPCMVLLDLVMPKMDGWRFLEAVRSDPQLRALPIIVVSAHAGSHAPTNADGLLPKPIDLTDLRRVVFRHCPN